MWDFFKHQQGQAPHQELHFIENRDFFAFDAKEDHILQIHRKKSKTVECVSIPRGFTKY